MGNRAGRGSTQPQRRQVGDEGMQAQCCKAERVLGGGGGGGGAAGE